MIEVYDIGNENWENHGNAVLMPLDARVKMVAGGNYDMTMTHPIDPEGKWEHLVPGAVLRVPVPEERIENAFSGYAADIYKVTATEAQVRENPVAPSAISYTTWTNGSSYAIGSKVSFLGKNYQCEYWDPTSGQIHTPPNVSAWWKEIPTHTSGAAVLVTVQQGGELYFVEDVDATWYKLSTYYGVVGYVKKSQVAFYRHLDPDEVKPRIIKDQLMRITGATVDTKNRRVSVTAQHVSYDLNGTIVQEVAIAQASPAMAIGRMMENLMVPYRGTIATNLTSEDNGTYTDTIKGKTGMYCLLDPDKGIIGTFGAELHRDNWDLFIMAKTETDRGFRLRYRKNMLGVSWARKSDSLINRVVPVAKDEKGESLYLPEKWIDSEDIADYPVIRMEILSVSGQVGKDKGDGTGDKWTLTDLYDEMRTKAAERFSVDKVDQIVEEVTVDFEMLGDTAENPELKKLETVLLYDNVGAINETIGMNVMLTVTELEWDAVREKVVSLKLSSGNEKAGKNVTGYNVQNKSIGVNKLSDDVAQGILEQVTDIIPEYADPSAARPGLPNTVSQDGVVTKGQGQASKVWKTDADGNPAWRDEQAVPAIVDNLTSTDTDKALSAKQGKELNDKFTAYEDITGTTDATGNILVTTIAIGNIIKAVPIRNETGYYSSFYYCTIAANKAASQALVHCMDANGESVASETVKIRIYHS